MRRHWIGITGAARAAAVNAERICHTPCKAEMSQGIDWLECTALV